MNGPSLRALPQFLRFVRTYPAPEPLFTALARGPLATWQARTGTLWRLEGEELIALARFGSTVEEAERYARLPLSVDFDVCRAIRTRQSVWGSARDFGDPQMGVIDADFWGALVDRVGGVSLVSVPLVLDDEPVGGFGFMTGTEWVHDEEATAVLDVLASVLALWLTHPLSPMPSIDPLAGRGQWSLSLTERQASIMRRVEQGWSTRGIATELGLSESTVKQDVQHVMRTMRTSDRRTAAERARTLGLML